MYDVLIFGTGAISDILLEYYLNLTKVNILAFINDIPNEKGKKNGYPIITFKDIGNHRYDYIIIAAGAYDEIRTKCIKAGIDTNKIVGVTPQMSSTFKSISEEVNLLVNKTFNLKPDLFIRRIPTTDISGFYLANEISLEDTTNLREHFENVDLLRAFTFYFLSREIKRNNVPGNVAELGVYKGDFAKIINILFPDKTLYLFDTFQGFDDIDLNYEKANQYSNTSTHLNDTSVGEVLSKMPYVDKCKIIKGYFPESTVGIDDIFSFVSLDTDLFLPIYEGLKFFYNRLSKNGYIFVHDFNNKYFSGAREAVMQFCSEENIGYTPVADYHGSVIITK